jgi:hypothetical protein
MFLSESHCLCARTCDERDSHTHLEGSLAYDYAREKLWQVVNTLVGDGSIQERLDKARTYLVRLHIPEEQLPEEQREEFKALMRELSSESSFEAGERKLSSEEGAKLARRILSICTALHGGI